MIVGVGQTVALPSYWFGGEESPGSAGRDAR